MLHPCFFEKNHGVKPHLRSQTGPGRIVYLAVALATGDFWCHVKPLICSHGTRNVRAIFMGAQKFTTRKFRECFASKIGEGWAATRNSTKNDRGHGGCCGVLGIKVCISTSGIFRNNASWCASSIWYKGWREINEQNPQINHWTESWFPVDFPLKEFEHSMIYIYIQTLNFQLSLWSFCFEMWHDVPLYQSSMYRWSCKQSGLSLDSLAMFMPAGGKPRQ